LGDEWPIQIREVFREIISNVRAGFRWAMSLKLPSVRRRLRRLIMRRAILFLLVVAGLASQAQESISPDSTNSVARQGFGARSILSPRIRSAEILAKFKEAYLKLGSPRVLIYVNRELVDIPMKVSGSPNDQTPVGKSLTQRTVEALEETFARLLKSATADLADQKMANSMMAGKILKAPDDDGEVKAKRDRDSLRKIADVAIEVLIAPAKDAPLPDVQATAIRLEDGRIVGQATTNVPGREAETDTRSMGETIALSLLEDMVKEAK
jgi:hypothetical protein